MRYLIFLLVLLIARNIYGQGPVSTNIDFKRADSIGALYPDYPLNNLKKLADNLTVSLSTSVEKFRAIYIWVCRNVDYDNNLYIRNKRRRIKWKDDPEALNDWNKRFSAEMFRTLLYKHRTVCTGYAYLLKELSIFAGIPCEIVNGYGRQPGVRKKLIPNHSWNAVNLDNVWYLCDPTWSSGVVDSRYGLFIEKYNDDYFLMDPSKFIRNHYPLDSAWILMEKRPVLESFLEGKL